MVNLLKGRAALG